MLTDNTRTQAREMTSDLSIYHGPAATMAVVLLEHMDAVAELEGAARAVGSPSKSQGTRTVLVSFDALIALEDLLPDQSGEGES